MKNNTLLDYWLVLYKRKTGILVVVLVSLVTAIVLSLLISPVYEAKAVCYIPTASPALPYLSTNAMDKRARDLLVPSTKEDDAGPYIGILKSKRLAEYTHREYPNKSVDKLLLSDVDFELSNEFMLEIYSRDKDPKLAANIANAYVRNMNLLLQEASLENVQDDNVVLRTQLAATERLLAEAKEDRKRYEEEKNIGSVNEEINQLTNQKNSYQSQVENADVQLREVNRKIAAYTNEIRKEGSLVSKNDLVLTSPLIDSLKQKLIDQAAQMASMRTEWKPDHPEVRRVKNQYDETSAQLRAEVLRLVSSQIKPSAPFYEQLRQGLVSHLIERSRLETSKSSYEEVVRRVAERLRKLPEIHSEWERLNDEVERHKKTYEQLLVNRAESQMQANRKLQYVVVLDEAKPPKTPAYPVLWLNIVVSTLFGFCAGIFYAFSVEYIDEGRRETSLRVIRAILSDEETYKPLPPPSSSPLTMRSLFRKWVRPR